MAAGDVHSGNVPLTADPWLITAAHVPELVSYIRSSKRQVPIMVFAPDAQRLYDRDRLASLLARDLAGVAAVCRTVRIVVFGDRIVGAGLVFERRHHGGVAAARIRADEGRASGGLRREGIGALATAPGPDLRTAR